MAVTEVRKRPCRACPYRASAPPGIWADSEYEKLIGYDAETFAQPAAGFCCHADPDQYCHGWAVVGESRPGHELLALRLAGVMCGRPIEVPDSTVLLHPTGAAAAAAGMRPKDDRAERAIGKLLRAHPRLRTLDAE